MKEQIKRYCNSIGIENIGFIECRRFDELYDFYDYRKNNKLENEFEENTIGLSEFMSSSKLDNERKR